MRKSTYEVVIPGLLALTIALVGCSAGGSAGAPDAPRVIEVTIDGYHFVPDHFTVKRGESVRFLVSNPDQTGHELFIGTIEEQAARRGTGAATPTDAAEISSFGYGIYLPALTDGEFDYAFSSESDLLIGCHIPGHWEGGMVATIDVEP